MNKSFFVLATLIIVVMAGCNEARFQKLPKSALEYKIVSGGGDKSVKYGNTIKFTAIGYYSDSLLTTPYDSIAQYVPIDSIRMPPDFLSIFLKAKKGDSIITRILVDSAEKVSQIPPYAKKGHYLGFRIKILDIITDSVLAETLKMEAQKQIVRADSIGREKQKGKDDETLKAYLQKNNITATRTAKGTYVEVVNPGDGMQVDSGKAVTVDYVGKTLEGKLFDRSYDSSGVSVHPFTFVIGQGGAIEGWDDGLRAFKKGGKGRIFIPSSLGYGQRGNGPDILPNACLMFDIHVADVTTAEVYQKKMAEQQKQQQQNQPKIEIK